MTKPLPPRCREHRRRIASEALTTFISSDNFVTINGLGAALRVVSQRTVAAHASQMYAANVVNFVEHFWDREEKRLRLDLDDEIVRGCLVTHEGRIVHERFRE